MQQLGVLNLNHFIIIVFIDKAKLQMILVTFPKIEVGEPLCRIIKTIFTPLCDVIYLTRRFCSFENKAHPPLNVVL